MQPAEYLARAALTQRRRQRHPAPRRRAFVERDLAANDLLAVDVRDEAVERRSAVRANDRRADRHLTPALERREKRALGGRVDHRRGVAERREQLARRLVVGADLNRDRALTRGRQPLRRVEVLVDALGDAEPVQPGRGEDRRVDVPLVHLSHARRHVAAQLDDLEIGTQREQLRAPPQARRSDARARRQIGERRRADRRDSRSARRADPRAAAARRPRDPRGISVGRSLSECTQQ